ncbi:MAG: Gfo/Idh/MocA family oxidoreductase [Pirellulales bacterium]|jgi:predicted dehydrogenase
MSERKQRAERRNLDRRTFVAQTTAIASGLAVTGAVAAPYFVPRSAFGANDRINTAHIGVKNQGLGNLKAFMNNAVAVCDVDKEVLSKAVKAVEQTGRTCDGYSDYRKVLERKDVDAVVISTPDHWHALMTIHACEAGKDVYCEKPLSLTISEGRKMVQAARKHERIVQTGSQQRSDAKFRQACELVRSGRIGKLETILVGIPGPNHPGEPVADSSPPPELDYEFWLGPAAQRPYNVKRVHYNFRFFWDYSGGQMTNFGAHHIDIAHWGMGVDDAGPLEIEGVATFHPKMWHEVSETCRVTYKYPGDVTMIVGQKQKDIPDGATFIGSKGKIQVTRGKIVGDPADLIAAPLGDGDVKLYVSGNHHKNFLECIKTRKLPICDVEIGHRSASACHLGNIAIRTGRKIRWDSAKEQILDDSEAAAMLERAYRAPWKLG